MGDVTVDCYMSIIKKWLFNIPVGQPLLFLTYYIYFKPNFALMALGIEFLCTRIEMVLALTYSSER